MQQDRIPNNAPPNLTPHVDESHVVGRTIAFAILALLLLALFFFGLPKAGSEENILAPAAVTLNPTVGPPTKGFHVSGSGFSPYANIDLYFDKTYLASSAADAAGTFGGKKGIKLAVPDDAVPGKHWVSAVDTSGGMAAQTSFLVQTNWPQFRFNPRHKGLNPYENVLSPDNVGNLKLRWSYTGIRTFTPSVAGGILYMSSRDDMSMYAFDAGTGAVLWKFGPTGYWVAATPAIANGIVYLGSDDGTMYALNATTGAVVWQYATETYGTGTPTVANGVVYFLSYDGHLNAVKAATGALLWRTPMGKSRSAPAVVDGKVYVATDDHNVYALDASTGTVIWTFATGNWTSSTPAVVNGVVYVGSCDNNFYALEATTGAMLWKYLTTGCIWGSAAVRDGLVYFASEDTSVYALKVKNGKLKWKFTTGGWIDGSPALANGVLYIGSSDNYLYALNDRTGAMLWKYNLGYWAAVFGPIVADGILYAGAYGDWSQGGVYAFDLPSDLYADKLTPPERPDPKLLTH